MNASQISKLKSWQGCAHCLLKMNAGNIRSDRAHRMGRESARAWAMVTTCVSQQDRRPLLAASQMVHVAHSTACRPCVPTRYPSTATFNTETCPGSRHVDRAGRSHRMLAADPAADRDAPHGRLQWVPLYADQCSVVHQPVLQLKDALSRDIGTHASSWPEII